MLDPRLQRRQRHRHRGIGAECPPGYSNACATCVASGGEIRAEGCFFPDSGQLITWAESEKDPPANGNDRKVPLWAAMTALIGTAFLFGRTKR